MRDPRRARTLVSEVSAVDFRRSGIGMNDLSPRKQNSPLQVFVAFLATLAVGVVLLAAVAHASSKDNAPQCPDTYTAVGQILDGTTDAQTTTNC